MKKKTMNKLYSRLLSTLLSLAVIFSGMPGLGGMIYASAEDGDPVISSVTCNTGTISENGGTVEVTVRGTNLTKNAYYKVWQNYTWGSVTSKGELVKSTTVEMSESEDGWTFNVDIPAKSTVSSYGTVFGYTVGVSYEPNGTFVTSDTILIVNEDGGTTGPIVDKTSLNGAIQAAKNLSKADYTSETWAVFASALSTAEATYSNDNATQEEVNSAKDALVSAQNDLVRAEPDIPSTPDVGEGAGIHLSLQLL